MTDLASSDVSEDLSKKAHANPSEPTAADSQASLESQKLALEVRELNRRWLFRPGNIAPVASILVALAGLYWATKTGYFETSRKLLEIDKRELQAEKFRLEAANSRERADLASLTSRAALFRQQVDYLSARAEILRKENSELRSWIGELEVRESTAKSQVEELGKARERLAEEVQALDFPFIIGSDFLRGPWSEPDTDRLELTLHVQNAGAPPGRILLVPYAYCREIESGMWSRGFTLISATPEEPKYVNWLPRGSHLSEKATAVNFSYFEASRLRNYYQTLGPPYSEPQCTLAIQAQLVRADGRDSNKIFLVFPPEADTWLRKAKPQ